MDLGFDNHARMAAGKELPGGIFRGGRGGADFAGRDGHAVLGQ